MKHLVSQTRRGAARLRNLAIAIAAAASTSAAFAQASAIETAAEGAITAGKTAADNLLGVAIGVLATFILFKLAKRAANKV